MFNARLVVALLAVSFLAPAGVADDVVLPPEKAYLAKLAKAQSEYSASAKKALEELRSELEKMKVDATKAGDLDKALSIRTKIEALGGDEKAALPASETGAVVGRFEFQYSNSHSREYVFTKDGNLIFVKGDGQPTNVELPGHQAKVYWMKAGDKTVGLIDWAHLGQFERVTFSKEGIVTSIHWPKTQALNGEGRKVK